MKYSLSSIAAKFLKITGITIASLVLLLFILPYLFPGFISDKIRQWAKGSIRSEMSFTSARLSFFKHFPALTLTLYDFRLNGSAPFEKEKLVEADEVSLGVDISSIFSSRITIDKIFLTHGFINIQADTAGHANYNVYVENNVKGPSNPADSGSASLRIKKILIEKSHLVYNDRSFPLLLNIRGLDYTGSGDLSQAVFDLNTHMEVDSLDFYYNRQAYFVSKKVNADLITKINTNSLALLFEKNNLLINQLPVEFTGRFEFLKDGYNMNFRLRSTDSDLHDIFTAMPPQLLNWLSKTDVKGFGDVDASLIGQYVADRNIMPDLTLDVKIRNGYISNAQAPSPISNLFLNFESRLPQLNPDSLNVRVDSLFFNLDKDYFSTVLQWRGLSHPQVSARVNSELDLEKWNRALGLSSFELKGRSSLHLVADGLYSTKVVRTTTLRKVKIDTVVTSIPRFTFHAGLSNGYFKYASHPEALKNIGFTLDASCADNDYRHTRLAVENFNANLLSSYIKGFFRLENAGTFPIDASLETTLHLSDIKKVMPLDSMELAGDLKVNVRSKGNYQPEKKSFPVTTANLELNNGSIRTKYYPHPIENIQVSAKIVSTHGSMKDLDVALTPVSFRFEGQPFTLTADLQNFDNLKYAIISRGILDLGRIYQVFAIQGYDVKGMVETNLSLKGRQSDAAAGRYDLLFNSGTMKVKDVFVRSELFPQPFHIKTGLFRFDQDKMWFDAFDASYGKTDLRLNGALSNVIGYMTDKKEKLKGSFELTSDYLLVDEFAAYAPPTGGAKTGGGQTGVILVPDNLSLTFQAKVKKVMYNGVELDSVQGQMGIDSGKLTLSQAGFTLIGAPVTMDAVYQSLSPQRAAFDYKINAKNFDVQRAYREIRLFHDLASSASKAQGIISLDYQLAGRLDGNMRPIYPSLKGGGTLSVSKVKVKGMKLFGAVSKETNKDVNDPDLSKVEIKSSINNNIITIERTRMKVSVFKLRMQGQASFDGRLNLQFRVGLPPFGVIGIPLKITGTQDNPKVSSRRGSKKDELEETEDKEEEGKEN